MTHQYLDVVAVVVVRGTLDGLQKHLALEVPGDRVGLLALATNLVGDGLLGCPLALIIYL